MKKHFMYFESTDGGMEVNHYEFNDDNISFDLYGWMRQDCIIKDEELVNWAKKAKIGDYFNHRLGVCVMVNNF